MAKHTDSNIDIDTYTWAELMALSVSDGTYSDLFEESKTDEGATIAASQVATKVGAIYGNKLGVMLEELWTKARAGSADIESTAAYVALAINAEVAHTAGVAATAFETAEIPEGFCGYITYELGSSGGSAASPVGGYINSGRATLRRGSGGTLQVGDVGATAVGEGTTYSYSGAANGNAFRVQLTIGSSTTFHHLGWYRIYGRVIP